MAINSPLDPIDGVDELHKRERTRLWYRAQPVTELLVDPVQALVAGKPVTAVRVIKAEPASPRHTDRLVRETVSRPRATADLVRILDEASLQPEATEEFDEAHALTEWRDAPAQCPVLLLSATSLLDARNPGPILGPGTSYRILTVSDGVVMLKVATLDGHQSIGYCNAVDLICIEPEIVNLRRERQTGKLGTARLNLSKLTQRITGATGSLGD